jgi:Gluconate 2-dehydrogenase subunit 3
MNRRTAIRNVVIISAGAGLLPSCMSDDRSLIALKNISVTGSQEKMLAELTEAIIPKTANFIGAKDLKAHEFILTMVDDCTSPEDQKQFTEGLKAFEKLSHDKFGQLFAGYTAEQKKSLLSDIESKKDIPEDVVKFYGTVKRYTVQSFTSSKEYMTGIRKYNMIPGSNFKGCVPVKAA